MFNSKQSLCHGHEGPHSPGTLFDCRTQEFDHHTTEEEEKWVPELVQALDGETVQKLSERFSATKTHEPTR
jgi:hypothetical protein